MTAASPPRTMFEKIWDDHVVHAEPGKQTILYIDLQLVHEVTSAQAFEGLRLAGRKVRRPERTVATADHNVPTTDRSLPILDPISKKQIDTLRQNCREFGIRLYDIRRRQPGDRPRDRARVGLHPAGHDDRLRRQPHGHPRRGRGPGLRHRHQRSRARAGHADAAAVQAQDAWRSASTAGCRRASRAKDLILYLIGRLSTSGGVGYCIEYTGEAIRAPEHGRADDGVQHDDRGRRPGRTDRAGREDLCLPARAAVRAARISTPPSQRWKQLPSDPARSSTAPETFDAAEVQPQVTWGTNPGQVATSAAACPIRPSCRSRRTARPSPRRSSTWA